MARRPGGHPPGFPLGDLPKDPADRLADEELLLRQHRGGVPLEAVEVGLAGADARQQGKERGTAHPEVVIGGPGVDPRPRRRVTERDAAGDVAGQRVDKRPGARVADQRLDGGEIAGAQLLAGHAEDLDRGRAALEDGRAPQRRRPRHGGLPVEAGIALDRRFYRAPQVRHGDADELQVALQVPLFLLGPFPGTQRAQPPVHRQGRRVSVKDHRF